jgi:solute carrier family 25 protein 16
MLSLLCEFIRYGPPHLHQFLETPLFTNLLRCLQTDTSTTVVSLALTALTMFLPHIPKDIATHLPSLFNIYCRLLFWDREKILSPEYQTQHADLEKSSSQNIDEKDSKKWESISFSPESDGHAVPPLLHYFSFLYGLYPINFMSYIRKPERYLRHANFQGGDDIEVQFTEIRQRSEPFRKVHLLHPNFFEMTIESELTDPNRWLKSDAADVVAQCLALCEPLYPAAFRLPEPIHVSKPQERQAMLDHDADVPNQPLLAESDEQIVDESRPVPPGAPNLGWRHTTSGPINFPDGSRTPLGADRKVSLPYEDSPTLSPIEVQTDSPTLPPQLLLTRSQDERERREMVQAEVEQSLPNESQVSLVSNQQHEPSVAGSFLHTLEQGHIPDSPLLKAATAGENSNIVALRREIMLLKNELNFEKYLKQQHLTHIGQLRRKHVREAAAEAETQNLINSNKTLKNKLEEVNNKMMQLKRESEKIRTHSKKWEADLTSKLRALKEEQKKWNLEIETLRRELETSRNDNNQLRKLVVSRESEELTSRQKVQSVEINLDEIERLRADVEKLTASVRTHEAREIEIERATASEALALAKAEILSLKLKAAEDELQRVRLEDTREIESLRAKLENTRQEMHDQPPKGYKSMLDAALAVSRARLNDAQKAHAHLLTKYTNLQQQLLAVTDHRNPDEPLLSSGGIHYHFDSAENSYRTSTSPEGRRMRRRGLSDPDTDEGMHSYGSSSKMSTYYPIKPAGMDTTLRPASGMDLRSPSSRIASSDHYGHSRSGSVDSTGASGALEKDANGKPKIKPSSEVRVYGRG